MREVRHDGEGSCGKSLGVCWPCWSVVHYDQSLGLRLAIVLPPEPTRLS